MELYNPEHNTDEMEPVTHMTMEEFDEYKASCLFLIEQAKAAAKLASDPNFIKIIMESYFTQEPQRLGSLMASGRLTPNGFDDAARDLRSIGHLRKYLQEFIEKGNIAAGELENLEIARAEAVEA